jgi:hypothetical protein
MDTNIGKIMLVEVQITEPMPLEVQKASLGVIWALNGWVGTVRAECEDFGGFTVWFLETRENPDRLMCVTFREVQHG